MYTLYAYTGARTGWQKVKAFSNPAQADEWLTHLIKHTGAHYTDYTIKAN